MNRYLSGTKRFYGMFRSVVELAQGALGSRGNSRLVILTYHRVLPCRDEILQDEPTCDEFKWQMQLLASKFNVVALIDAVDMLRDGTLPNRSVAVTFDDGYRNNFNYALPILQEAGLPATFFVATGFLQNGCMWNDCVIESIRAMKDDRIDLTHFRLGELQLQSVSQKRIAIDKILSTIKYLDFAERGAIVDDLVSQSGINVPQDMMMSADQVSEIARAGCDIGAHTVNHPILARISNSDAKCEIESGKAELEEITGSTIELFAFPNGRPGTDYNQDHVDMLRTAGFKATVTTRPGYADVSSSLQELPRVGAHQADKLRFLSNLISAFSRV